MVVHQHQVKNVKLFTSTEADPSLWTSWFPGREGRSSVPVSHLLQSQAGLRHAKIRFRGSRSSLSPQHLEEVLLWELHQMSFLVRFRMNHRPKLQAPISRCPARKRPTTKQRRRRKGNLRSSALANQRTVCSWLCCSSPRVRSAMMEMCTKTTRVLKESRLNNTLWSSDYQLGARGPNLARRTIQSGLQLDCKINIK